MAASSGCYVLAVVAEPVSEDHKQIILQRLSKGLLSWDVNSTGCDLNGLENICASVKEKGVQDSDLLIQYSTESLGVEVLVNPPVNTLKQCVKNLLTSTIGHKHIIHAGYTFTGSGSWILQNGTYSFQDFLNAFKDAKGISPRGSTIHIHCVEEGDWTSENFSKEVFTKIANVSLNPADKIDHLPGSEHLVDCLESVLTTYSLTEIMEASPLVGNIRFNRPTLYLFPAGEGDCALFGINGFNMLIDGGFNRKPCSWDFIRHLDRLDAVLVTRLSESNLCSMSTLMKRKTLNNTYPQIGYVFCNIAEGKNPSPTEELQKDRSDLLVSIVGEGHNFIHTLNDLKLIPHQSWRDSTSEPFVLYHKVGHGTLEMHILSPPKDSKEMKDFLSEWSAYKEKFSCVKFKGQMAPIPLSHATSICAILVWRPNDPKDTITRILFSGSAPQSKIFEGLDKLKGLDILKQPVVTKASLNAVILSKPKAKTGTPITKGSIPNRKNTASPALSVSSVASRNGDISGIKREVGQTRDNRAVKEVKKVAKEVKKELKSVKDVKKENKEVKKEVKKEPKEIKKELKKEHKPVTEKVNAVKSTARKSEPLKSAADLKKTSVKKTLKKESSKSPAVLKSAEKEVKKTTKTAETKTAKEVINKKAAEAKTVSKPKTKPTHAAAMPSPGRTKPTPVPKSPSKITRAIAASAAVATAAVAVGVAEFIESKREEEEEEKEEVLNIEMEEVKTVPELLQNGIGEVEGGEHVPVSPLRQETMSPALSEPVSLTASDTLSSAPMETVSPTPPQEIISPAEEKEVNEIKEVDLQTPTDYEKFPDQEADETAETPVIDHAEIETAVDEGIVDDNVEEKVSNQTVLEAEGIPDEQDDAGYDASTDLMTTSFMGDNVELAVEEKVVSETAVQDETFVKAESALAKQESEVISVEPVSADVLGGNESIEIPKVDKSYDSIEMQFASATMEGSFCAGLTSEEQGDKPHGIPTTQDITYNAPEELKSNVMETSIVFEDHEEANDDYVQQVINQYKETPYGDEVSREIMNHGEYADHPDYSGKTTDDVVRKSLVEDEHKTDEQNKVTDIPVEHGDHDSVGQKDQYEDTVMAGNTSESELKGSSELMSDYEQTRQSGISEYYDPHSDEHLAQHGMESASDYIDTAKTNDCILEPLKENVSISECEAVKTNEHEFADVNIEKELEVPLASATSELDGMKEKVAEAEPEVDIQRDTMKCEMSDMIGESDVSSNKIAGSSGLHDTEDHLSSSLLISESNVSTAEEFSKQVELSGKDEGKKYPTEEKQDLDEKDRDSAEDEEMIRHPTPPGEQEFYQQVGPRDDDEMRDPIGQHFITPTFRTKGQDADEPLYEEPEDSSSDRSKSPVVEQPVFSNIDKANYPELVTVSGGTTPSEPQSPKSPCDNKKSAIAALDVMEALSEHDCSESSTQSPLVREGPSTFDKVDIVHSEVHGYSADIPPPEEQEDSFQAHEDVCSELNDGSNIHYDESKLGVTEIDIPNTEGPCDTDHETNKASLINELETSHEHLESGVADESLVSHKHSTHEVSDESVMSHEHWASEVADEAIMSHELSTHEVAQESVMSLEHLAREVADESEMRHEHSTHEGADESEVLHEHLTHEVADESLVSQEHLASEVADESLVSQEHLASEVADKSAMSHEQHLAGKVADDSEVHHEHLTQEVAESVMSHEHLTQEVAESVMSHEHLASEVAEESLVSQEHLASEVADESAMSHEQHLASEVADESEVHHEHLTHEVAEESAVSHEHLSSEVADESAMSREHLASEVADESAMSREHLASEVVKESAVSHEHLASEVVKESAVSHEHLASEIAEESAVSHKHLASEVAEESAVSHKHLASEVAKESAVSHEHLVSEVAKESAVSHEHLASEVAEESAVSHEHLASEVAEESEVHSAREVAAECEMHFDPSCKLVSESELPCDSHDQVTESEILCDTSCKIEAEPEVLSDPATKTSTKYEIQYDASPEALAESEMHCAIDETTIASEIPFDQTATESERYDQPKCELYEQESDIVYKAESEQFAVKSENQDLQQYETSKQDVDLKDSVHSSEAQLNECAESETFHTLPHEDSHLTVLNKQGPDSSDVSVPSEFPGTYYSESFTMSGKVDSVTSEIVESYSHESSTCITESSYHYQSETPEQNRYSSASTVELDNSKHSSENVSNLDQFEVEGRNDSPYTESCHDQEEPAEQTNASEHYKGITSEETDTKVKYAEDCDKTSVEHEHYPNGFSASASDMSAAEAERDLPHSGARVLSSAVNGQELNSWKTYSNDFSSVEITRNNGTYNSTFTEVSSIKMTSSEQASYIIDPHYQSDSPEDNSMKNDSPPDIPSPVDPERLDALNPLTAAPPAGYDGISNKYMSTSDCFTSENLNCTNTIPKPAKNKYNQGEENPYGESSEDDDSSSLPGNVSPYAYTNKAYNQEDDADGNHIYKQSFRIEQNTDASKMPTTFDINNPHPFSENTTFDSHASAGMTYSPGFPDMHAADPNYDFRLEEWGKPMGLPTPPEPPTKTAKKPIKSTPTTKTLTKTVEKRSSMDNGKPPLSSKLGNSPIKKAKENETESKPVYVDLAYVPHHGDPNYSDVEFFRKIRARYYVFSGIGPSREVLNALLEAKKSWKEELEVTIIPTYETDTLGYWLAQNQDTLAEYSIEVAPSASRCTVNLQDHETSCAAYRLEF